MTRKFAIAWLLLFIVWMVGSFIVHGVLLHDDYVRLPNMFRTDAEAGKYFPFMLLAHVILAAAFAWIYSRGVEAKPWPGQGIRFGAAVALLTVVPTYLIYYAVQPMPGGVVLRQIAFDTALLLILGATVGFLYRNDKRA